MGHFEITNMMYAEARMQVCLVLVLDAARGDVGYVQGGGADRLDRWELPQRLGRALPGSFFLKSREHADGRSI